MNSPVRTLSFIGQSDLVLNDYIRWLNADDADRRARDENDEQAMINALAGLGGLIEYNVRTGYQRLARRKNLGRDEYHLYSEIIEALADFVPKEEHRRLLKAASQIRNKLLHADFPGLYRKTREAYEIPGIEYQQSAFTPTQRTFLVTVSAEGAALDAQSGVATDSTGRQIPVKELVPGAGGSIEMDFSHFYDTGHFVHVYDVLTTTYRAVLPFRYEA